MIDLNADVGEGYDDLALMPFVSSVNIACGGHAGDERTMSETVEAAKRFAVAIGAHPSYPDREHFGRREVAISREDLEAAIGDQIRVFVAIVHAAGSSVRHVKPHGALYNVAARDASTARAIARAVRDVDRRFIVVGLAGSRLVEVARELGLRAAGEAFADRRYAADGSLLPRSDAQALVREPGEAADQALSIARDRIVRTDDGGRLSVVADTLCVHGDTPGAAAIARCVRERLREAGVTIAPL